MVALQKPAPVLILPAYLQRKHWFFFHFLQVYTVTFQVSVIYVPHLHPTSAFQGGPQGANTKKKYNLLFLSTSPSFSLL